MITLGIETSCDETAVALVDGPRVLAACVASSAETHAEFGGVVPEIASRCHLEALMPLLASALKKARVKLSRIGLIAVTRGPGLAGSLLVGVSAAKALALALGKPVVGVDHVMAHAYSGRIGAKRPFPFMALVVSGGHTLLIDWKDLRRARIIGRTLDDAAGEAFDKVAKMLGLGYPGGPEIERIARGGDAAKYKFPRPGIREEHLDFSFSGLKTAVLYKLDELRRRGPLRGIDKKDIAASFQEAACEVLVRKSLRAARAHGARTLVVGGGVSANGRLRALFARESRKAPGEASVEVIFPSAQLAADNAVMIAALGQAMGPPKARPGAPKDFDVYSDFFVQKSRGVLYNRA